MEKNVNIDIFKDDGNLWKWHANVPKSSFRIENGFVIIDLGETVHMYPVHKIERIMIWEADE